MMNKIDDCIVSIWKEPDWTSNDIIKYEFNEKVIESQKEISRNTQKVSKIVLTLVSKLNVTESVKFSFTRSTGIFTRFVFVDE